MSLNCDGGFLLGMRSIGWSGRDRGSGFGCFWEGEERDYEIGREGESKGERKGKGGRERVYVCVCEREREREREREQRREERKGREREEIETNQ